MFSNVFHFLPILLDRVSLLFSNHHCGSPPPVTLSAYFVLSSVFSLIVCPVSYTWPIIYSLQISISIVVPTQIPSHPIKSNCLTNV